MDAGPTQIADKRLELANPGISVGQRQVDLAAMEESFVVLQKRLNTYQVASARFEGAR